MFKKPCPCGCGRKLGASDRRKVAAVQGINSHVELLTSETLPAFTSTTSFEEATPLRKFIQEGRDLSGQLDAEVHGGSSRQMMQHIEQGPVNPRLAHAWVQTAKDIEVASHEELPELLGILGND